LDLIYALERSFFVIFRRLSRTYETLVLQRERHGNFTNYH
jgi:hypothetical protein